MVYISNINNIDLKDYKDSYTLKCIIEAINCEFYKEKGYTKAVLLKRLDKEISEKLKMPEAIFLFEDNEHTLDDKHIYFGKLSNIKSPSELLGRYFFEKRQQYQRMCINNNDRGSFSEEEYCDLKMAYDVLPISKGNMYIPYNKGLDKYLLNYNKVDAILYMMKNLVVSYEIIDMGGVLKNLSYTERNKLIKSCDDISKENARIVKTIEKIKYNKKYSNLLMNKIYDFQINKYKENYMLVEMMMSLLFTENSENEEVLLFFHDRVWENLDERKRMLCVECCNEYIAAIMGVDVKDVLFDKGSNSYNFVDNSSVHVGELNDASPHLIILKLVYEYGFDAVYNKVVSEEKNVMLEEYNECKEIYMKRNSYRDIKEFEFIKEINNLVVMVQKEIYNYMNNNLYVNGKRIRMPMSKEDFIIDIIGNKKKR